MEKTPSPWFLKPYENSKYSSWPLIFTKYIIVETIQMGKNVLHLNLWHILYIILVWMYPDMANEKKNKVQEVLSGK